MSTVSAGKHYPLGASLTPDGVNFCVFSKNCDAIELLLFDHVNDRKPSRVIPLTSDKHRTFYYWHAHISGIQAGQCYAYRVHGRYDPAQGHRFDGSKVLIDPYGRALAVGNTYDRGLACRYGVDNAPHAMKSVVADLSRYDWEGDKPLNLPYANSVIYEMHVGGFTKHPSSRIKASERGTYRALIEKIPYLTSLGINAVELMPVYAFDPYDAPNGKINYWGYSPVSFFAPHVGYSTTKDPLGTIDEFRDMVKALHRNGIEVILDVVFNHTAEGNQDGATFCYRGFENRAYYTLEQNRAYYANYSGCGNTLNANHSIVRRLIMDSLRYWVDEMHVDGFRFDLASTLTRDEFGNPLASPPLIWEIDSEPILAGTKIIAEAWDAGGLYQVGAFTGDRWADWNGKFRDDVRRFMKGDSHSITAFATRLTASKDLYQPNYYQPNRDPNRSINFVTCHDGLTLYDLVSYNSKHNEANGEDNRDGNNDNHSWNCGQEGDSNDPAVIALRDRQVKNFYVALFMAQGTPMILMGDEVGRTQQGNNNAYCQDNALSWLNWTDTKSNTGILRFVRELIRFTQSTPIFSVQHYWADEKDVRLSWHGTRPNQPDWGENSHALALTLDSHNARLYVAFNAYWEDLAFELPSGKWWRIIDTARPSPDDFLPTQKAPRITASRYTLTARSAVVFVG